MTAWLVLDMDEGVRGAFATRKAAVAEFNGGIIVARHQSGSGAGASYDYRWLFERDDPYDGGEFFVKREPAVGDDEWAWCVDAWRKAGRPMGRFDEPYGDPASDDVPVYDPPRRVRRREAADA